MLSNIFSYSELKKKPDFHILKFKEALYRGQITEQDKREGMGIMIYESGRIYEGFWHNDVRNG